MAMFMVRVAITIIDSTSSSSASLLSIRKLDVVARSIGGRNRLLSSIDLELRSGETLALLGEAGSGKSLLASAINGSLDQHAGIETGEILLQDVDLGKLSPSELRSHLGRRVATIFHDPIACLNPGMTVMQHLAEVLACHRNLVGEEAHDEARRLLIAVGLSSPASCFHQKPSELALGTAQAVAIALALAGRPQVLLADEPTGWLDPTMQTHVLALFEQTRNIRGMGILLFTRDPDVARKMAQRVAVMLDGEVVEQGSCSAFMAHPLHPFSRSLLEAQASRAQRGQVLRGVDRAAPVLQDRAGCCYQSRCPSAMADCSQHVPEWQIIGAQRVRCHLYRDPDALDLPSLAPRLQRRQPIQPRRPAAVRLEVRGLRVGFEAAHRDRAMPAVDGVDFSLESGRTLALLGESGSGKSGLGKAVAGLIRVDEGQVFLDGSPLVNLFESAFAPTRRALQMIFQSPRAALNPFARIGDIVAEGMIALGLAPDPDACGPQIVQRLLRVGLTPALAGRYPDDLDDFALQCVAIARAVALSPRVLICDEPVARFDAGDRARLLNLLRELQEETGMSILLMTRHPGVAGYLADDVAVLYRGRIVEQGTVEAVFSAPAHPYTRALVAASVEDGQIAGGERATRIVGDPHTGMASSQGCRFSLRCTRATEICQRQYPAQTRFGSAGHFVRCHWPG